MGASVPLVCHHETPGVRRQAREGARPLLTSGPRLPAQRRFVEMDKGPRGGVTETRREWDCSVTGTLRACVVQQGSLVPAAWHGEAPRSLPRVGPCSQSVA